MTYFKNTIFFFIRLLRFILNIPLLLITKAGSLYVKLLFLIDTRNHDSYWQESLQKILDSYKSKKIKISDNPIKFIQFYHPSQIASFRSKTLFSKEPETIKWLETHGSEQNCFYDIGANLGLYSIFYAKKFNSKVYSFEPSYRNLDLMVRNIKLNSLENNISIIPNALNKNNSFENFSQTDFTAGAAQASFGKESNHGLKNNKSISNVSYKTLGLSIDSLIKFNVLDKPQLIKIDVDGNEVEIIEGCKEILLSAENLYLMVEIRDKTRELIFTKLKSYGFKQKDQIKDNSFWEK